MNEGTAMARPRLIFERSGGTSARLVQVRNESTGKALHCDYGLLDGERLTMELDASQGGGMGVRSSFFGDRMEAILANSEVGGFGLQAGGNLVTCLVTTVGNPDVLGWMEWRVGYRSAD